ncbi:MAG: glycosyltransferase 87 family protein, partial [Candidatus Binatia bacterium]
MHPGTLWSNRLKAAAFALALVLTLFSTANWWSIYSHHAPACSPECAADFVTFYAAAKLFVDHPGSLYDIDQQLAYQNQIAPSQQALPFVYPPITAVMMAPLAWLHFSNAFLTVTLLNGVFVWLSLRKLIRHLHLASDQSHWLILFALCNYGVHHLLYQGQLSALILFLLTNYVLLQKERDNGRSGVWMSLLCVKPQFVPMPGLFLFLQGKWRGLIAGAVLSATWTIAAFLLVGAEATQQFFLLLQRMVIKHNDRWNQLHGMHNLRALAVYWLPPATQSYFWWTICGLLILVLAWINLRFRQRPGNFAACWTA